MNNLLGQCGHLLISVNLLLHDPNCVNSLRPSGCVRRFGAIPDCVGYSGDALRTLDVRSAFIMATLETFLRSRHASRPNQRSKSRRSKVIEAKRSACSCRLPLACRKTRSAAPPHRAHFRTVSAPAKGPTNGPNLNGRRRSKRSEARALSSRFEEGMKLVALMRPRLRSVTLSPSAERMQENQVRSAAHFRTGGVVVSPPRHPPFSHGCLEAPGPPPMPLRVRMQFIRAEAIG